MKRVFAVMMAVLLATAMVSCTEKEEGPTLNDNNITAVNDEITAMESYAFTYMGHIGIELTLTEEGTQRRLIGFSGSVDMPLVGTTIDLTTTLDTDAEYDFTYERELEPRIDYSQRSGRGRISSFINHDFANEPAFTSGTLTTSLDNKGFTYHLSGTLRTGQRVVAKGFVANEDIDHQSDN